MLTAVWLAECFSPCCCVKHHRPLTDVSGSVLGTTGAWQDDLCADSCESMLFHGCEDLSTWAWLMGNFLVTTRQTTLSNAVRNRRHPVLQITSEHLFVCLFVFDAREHRCMNKRDRDIFPLSILLPASTLPLRTTCLLGFYEINFLALTTGRSYRLCLLVPDLFHIVWLNISTVINMSKHHVIRLNIRSYCQLKLIK